MQVVNLLPAALLLIATSAPAQEANPHAGTWRAEFLAQRGTPLGGKVVMGDKDGTWDLETRAKNDPCAGRAAPIAVQRATADELVIEVSRSKSLAGCRDEVVTFKRMDDKTLEGTFGSTDRKIKLVRE